MRPFLLTGLVVLQVVGLGDGLPHPSLDVYDEDLSPGTWTQTTQASFRLVSPPDEPQKPAVVSQVIPSTTPYTNTDTLRRIMSLGSLSTTSQPRLRKATSAGSSQSCEPFALIWLS
jgi:acyl-CoA hydrolase